MACGLLAVWLVNTLRGLLYIFFSYFFYLFVLSGSSTSAGQRNSRAPDASHSLPKFLYVTIAAALLPSMRVYTRPRLYIRVRNNNDE